MASDSNRKGDPIYGVAIMKVAYELRGKKLLGYEHILRETMDHLGVKEAELERYIARNRQALEETCRERGLV